MILLPNCECCKCPLGECQITIEFLDENRCEDDVFDLYLKNPTTEAERFIETVDLASDPPGKCGEEAEYADIQIPVTVTPEDFDENCKVIIGVRYVSPNCCNTYARFRIRRPNGCVLYGNYFGQSGLETIYSWSDLCNDDPCGPPPGPCCTRLDACQDGTLIRACGDDLPGKCCSSHYDDNSDANLWCSGDNPPATSCEKNGQTPAPYPPYDCLEGSFSDGAWVTVSGWSAYIGDTSGLSADQIALIAEVEAKVNQTFHVPLDCLGAAEVTIDLGQGQARDEYDCSGSHWFALVSVDLCARTASVNAYNTICYDGTDIAIDVGDLESLPVPCNSWSGCICEGYDDDIPTGAYSGGGTLTVSNSA